MAQQGASVLLPDDRSLPALCRAAASCQACDLWRRAAQTVFGEGSPRARVMLVGEQPGSEEDRAGRPFVGPAGRLRAPDSAARHAEMSRFIEDLRLVSVVLEVKIRKVR